MLMCAHLFLSIVEHISMETLHWTEHRDATPRSLAMFRNHDNDDTHDDAHTDDNDDDDDDHDYDDDDDGGMMIDDMMVRNDR